MDEQGLNDAAIFLMSLGEEEASEVFKHFSPKEVQKLGEAIARMRSVSRDKVDEVVTKFTNAAAAQSLLVSDTSDYVRSVLKRALGDDKASLLIDRILQGGDVSGIESLKWMDPLSVAELLRGEHPQIIAAILVHLEYEQSAAVLKQFTERQRSEVMLRVATLEGIQPIALKDLNEVLFKVLAGGDRFARRRWAASRRRQKSSTCWAQTSSPRCLSRLAATILSWPKRSWTRCSCSSTWSNSMTALSRSCCARWLPRH